MSLARPRILIILPDAKMHKLELGGLKMSFREAPLTHTTLAALVPGELNADVRVVDGSVETIPYDAEADLVAVSLLTGTALRGYAIAERFRRREIPVVLGGVHVTVLPGEAQAHADAIVIGRGEETWPQLLRDFVAGGMKSLYVAPTDETGILSHVPPARRDLQKRGGYTMPNAVQATRGCKRRCDFCSVTGVWPQYLRRPIADVIDDIRSFPGKFFAFNDVSLADDRAYAMELFTAMIPLKRRWGGLVTADAALDEELVDLMARSGCGYLLIGFESQNQSALKAINKGFNRVQRYDAMMQLLHRHGISVQGCFVFGFDDDDTDVFRETVERVQELKIDIPRYSLYTPYPGTPLFDRLLSEGRIRSFNWDDYDTMHAVIEPARMSPDRLYEGFKWAYRETFRVSRIAHRVARASIQCPVNFVGNLTYRIFTRRLERDPRFAQPCFPNGSAPPAAEHWRRAFLEEKEIVSCA